MPDHAEREVSPALAAALDTYRAFLAADDVERGDAIEMGDRQTLQALVDAVDPLYAEINATLHRLTSADHPLPEELEALEMDLNSLAQAAMEARPKMDSSSMTTPSV